jgi:hypothetical protein
MEMQAMRGEGVMMREVRNPLRALPLLYVRGVWIEQAEQARNGILVVKKGKLSSGSPARQND